MKVWVAVRPREGDIVWRNGGGIWIVGTKEVVMVLGGDATELGRGDDAGMTRGINAVG